MSDGQGPVPPLGNLRSLPTRLGDEPSFQAVMDSLRAGGAGTIDGVWGSARAMVLAALADHWARTVYVVVPHAQQVEPLVEDLASMTAGRPLIFPALEEAGRQGASRSSLNRESYGKRLQAIEAVRSDDPPRIVVTTVAALLQPLPSDDKLARHSILLSKGQVLDVEKLARGLTERGWRRREAVELSGELSIRGGIVDLFSIDAEFPLRLELFGDEIESIRFFNPETQRSIREVNQVRINTLVTYADDEASLSRSSRTDPWRASAGPAEEPDTAHLAEMVAPGSIWGLVEPIDLQAEGKNYLNRLEDPSAMFSVEASWSKLIKHPTVSISAIPHPSVEVTCSLAVETVERFVGDMQKVREELDRAAPNEHVLLACHNEAEVRRLEEVLSPTNLATSGRLHLTIGKVSEGFRWVTQHCMVISDDELFHRSAAIKGTPRRRYLSKAIDSFIELSAGDYVVHLSHGIGIYRGMKVLEKNEQFEEHLMLEFDDGVLIYVPASKMGLVQKYVGSGQAAPKLSKVGGQLWEKRKRQVEQAVKDLAVDLLEVQAARETQSGVAYPVDTVWQNSFEEAFPWEETSDQITSLVEIKQDMQRVRPMDRLLCGDVGYGKTELAMRAAFKATDFGKQVAILVPTTVLAHQHLRTFRQRMAEFPFVVEAVTRFESKKDQKRILAETKEGKVDILIGTHRILSADVGFHDLGLVIIDEEQRFGVAHKERLKQMRRQVDVLTLSATPIPRTLHSALLGIRDISNLQTPPENRLAIETRIGRFDPAIIRHAIVRELNRDGQVFFVHNRIQDMNRLSQRLQAIVPESRITIVHGQMDDETIEDRMVAFLERRYDVLLATTIIESGLDITNANTIFIDEGDRYGLSELHQLRGRVGRSQHRAYCYVLVDEHKLIKPEAQKRLKAIEEYSQLGAGFQIALRDLEIRGAGNILGAQQSGHIAAVGYELYCQLLDSAVRHARKQPLRSFLDVTIELPWSAYFPHDYIPGERIRIDAYRRLARVADLDGVEEFRREMRDRFGPVPEPALHLIDLAELRLLAQIWQIDAVRPDEAGNLVVHYRHRSRMATLEKLRNREIFAIDERSAYIRVPADQRSGESYVSILKRLLQPN
ncbi:transcription-repair coupling factor [bacterium]|nr:transcription-repair coupling factor [bacterium]